MFASEADILPAPIAGQLKAFLEQHLGLRPFYPEIASFYRDVRTGKLEQPLPLDAVDGVRLVVRDRTPEVFDPSVSAGLDDSASPPLAIDETEAPPSDVNQPTAPLDPLGEMDESKVHDFQLEGVINRLWQVFTAGEKAHKALGAWRSSYDALVPPVTEILKWLADFVGK